MRPEFWDAVEGDGIMTSREMSRSQSQHDKLKCVPAPVAAARSRRDRRNKLRHEIGAGDPTTIKKVIRMLEQSSSVSQSITDLDVDLADA